MSKTLAILMKEMYDKEVPNKSLSYEDWELKVYLSIAEKILATKGKKRINVKKEI